MLLYFLYILISPGLFFLLHIAKFFKPKIYNHLLLEKQTLYKSKKTINQTYNKQKKILLFHATSLGEFEQLKPLLKKIDKSKYLIIQTFTSPTAYTKEKENKLFDICCYHPYDFLWSSYVFFKALKPDKYIITRHDIWPTHLFVCKYLNIPCFYINANIHKRSIWSYKIMRSLSKAIFSIFTLVFVPSERIKNNLLSITQRKKSIIITGDTRFDQILDRKNKNKDQILPNHYTNTSNIIFGSYDQYDEILIINSLKKLFNNGHKSLDKKKICIFLVPHEINYKKINKLFKSLKAMSFNPTLYSQLHKGLASNVLIVDKVGILADLYKYCKISYVGSGFTTGVHSVIEPAAYGCIIGFGPKFQLLDEAISMYHQKLCQIISNPSDMQNFISLIQLKSTNTNVEDKLEHFIQSSLGATNKIIDRLNL